MTALANARVDVMTALVSFERVFEVLDLPPMITERPDARALPDGPVGVRLRDVRFAYPARRAGVAGLAGGGRRARPARRRGGAARHRPARSGPGGCSRSSGPPGRASRRSPRWCRGSTTSTRGAVELAGIDVRDLTFAAVRGAVGVVTQDGHLFHDTIRGQPALRRPGRHRRRAGRRAAPGPARRAARRAARRPGHRGGGARLPALRRRAPAADDRPAAAGPAAGGDPRRGHRAPGLRVRGRGAGGAGRGAGRAHRDRHRAPALDDPGGRPDRGGRARPDRRARHPRRAARRGRPLRRAVPHPVRRRPSGSSAADAPAA